MGGWSETDIKCKKHPKQRQSPGVCSACLRERLSQLSTRNKKITTTSSCSSSVSTDMYSSGADMYSSGATSSYSSPIHHHRHRGGSMSMKGPISFLIKGDDGLMRSKSMAFLAREQDMDIGMDRRINKKKKSGFWSRLINGSSVKRKHMKKEMTKQSKQVNQMVY